MKHITYDMLRDAGVCTSQLQLFRDAFGDCAPLTKKSLSISRKVDLEVEWLARLLSPSVWAEYTKMCDAAWAEYEKVHDAAWAEYTKVRDAAQSKYTKVRDVARAEYKKACDAALLSALRAQP